MEPSARHTNSPTLSLRRAGPASTVALAVALLAVALLSAACGGGASPNSGVAAVASVSATATSSANGSKKGGPLAFSKCMRAHGIKDFPDPDADGNLSIQGKPGGDLGPDNPKMKAAQNACQSLLRMGKPQTPAQQAQNRAAMLKYAECMRSHGIKDFPDPNSDGSMMIKGGPGSDLAPDNPQFKTADTACKHFMPGGKGKGGSLHVSGGSK